MWNTINTSSSINDADDYKYSLEDDQNDRTFFSLFFISSANKDFFTNPIERIYYLECLRQVFRILWTHMFMIDYRGK